jgi:F-type H+-transporting ATPase subunit b
MTNATTHTEATGVHSPFPPFQSEYFASQLVSLAVCFALLYVLISKIALPRISSILMDRNQRIADDLGAAQRFKERSDAANAAHAKFLGDARVRAQEIASTAREKHAAEAEVTRKRLEVELHQRLEAAEQSITASRELAMNNIETIARDAAAAIVKRLTGQTPVVQRGQSAAGVSVKG